MVNFNALPLFPLQVVLYPDMPLPLFIFEPCYREMILRCREENLSFGVVLSIGDGASPLHCYSQAIGTTARITQYEELADGCMNIMVIGETRFRVLSAHDDNPYLTAHVEPIQECTGKIGCSEAAFETASTLFRKYIKLLFLRTGRVLSTLQLPQDPELLSYVVAAFLPLSLTEKQRLLEILTAENRLVQEIQILQREIAATEDAAEALPRVKSGIITPVNARELGRLASRN